MATSSEPTKAQWLERAALRFPLNPFNPSLSLALRVQWLELCADVSLSGSAYAAAEATRAMAEAIRFVRAGGDA